MAEMKEEKAMDQTTDQEVNSQDAGEAGEQEEAGTSGQEETGEEINLEEEEQEASGQEEEGSEQAGTQKGFFGKKKDKKDKKDIQIEELTDRVRRQMAEFDNFRKRTEKEKAAMYEIGARSVIEKILPVVDNFERGLAVEDENSQDPFVQGMQKIYKQLMSTLEAMEVKPIEAVGKEFNPDFHNAVMHVEDENLGENMVAEELQKGYMYRDTVVRHSMVKVAN